jgi:phenylalanyl-tRNA synthetase alpha chain
MDPLATLEEALASAAPKVGEAATVEDIDRIESALLGKESAVGQVRRAMAAIAPEDRPRVGARLNEVTTEIQRLIEARRAELQAAEDARRLAEDAIDVTLESVRMPAGSRHLIQQVIDEVVDIFVGLGYRVAEGPEAELAWYNFDALNTPKTHPSRLESDTMYLDWGNPEDEVLLRTQTSPVQARYMESHQPPVYIVAPGRTYRTDTVDATHLPVFHQIEGLAVDEGLTLGDLRGTLAHFAREFFGSGTQVRLRAQRRARRLLLRLRRWGTGLPCVRRRRVARDARLRDGRPERALRSGVRPGGALRLRLRRRRRAAGDGPPRPRLHQELHRQRHPLPEAVPMKVSLRWLQEYIDLPTTDPDELAGVFTNLGFEVEGVERLGIG